MKLCNACADMDYPIDCIMYTVRLGCTTDTLIHLKNAESANPIESGGPLSPTYTTRSTGTHRNQSNTRPTDPTCQRGRARQRIPTVPSLLLCNFPFTGVLASAGRESRRAACHRHLGGWTGARHCFDTNMRTNLLVFRCLSSAAC